MLSTRICRPPFGRPMHTRSFVLPLLVSLALPAWAREGTAQLTEAEAVRLALSRAAVAQVVEGTIAAARSDAVEAGLWPNPELSFARERADGGPSASSEHYLWLSQTVDLAGRRGLQRKAAGHRVGRAVHEAEALRRDLAAETRVRFLETLLAQERVALARRFSARVERLALTVGKREAAGDASGYDRRRVEREASFASGRLHAAEASLESARARLGVLIGGAHDPTAPLVVAGTLPPDELPPLESVQAGLTGTSEIRALEEEAAAAALETTAAARWWLPDLTLGGGYKEVSLPAESLSGLLLSASVALPILDRGQGRSLHAKSRHRLALGRRELALARLTGEALGLWQEASRLAGAARAQGSAADPDALEHIAEAAYEGGEAGVLELVDAHRGAIDSALFVLDLRAAAHRARIELDRLTGGGPQ